MSNNNFPFQALKDSRPHKQEKLTYNNEMNNHLNIMPT